MRTLLLALALASRTVFSFADPDIDESSGLVDLGALMVTTNDSGDDAVLYVIDPRTGRTVGHTRYGADVTDVEALAPAGHGQVWAADIGDNNGVRSQVAVYRVPVGRGERTVDAPAYRLTYPDGPRDAESIFVANGRLYVVSKGILGGKIYAAPKLLRTDRINMLRKVGRTGEFATDAALFPDGRHVLIRGYGTAEVRTVPGFRRIAAFDLPDQEQGEGVSIGAQGRIRLSSEGAGSPVLQIELPPRVLKVMEPPASPRQVSRPSQSDGTSTTPWWVGGVVAALLGVAGWRRRRR